MLHSPIDINQTVLCVLQRKLSLKFHVFLQINLTINTFSSTWQAHIILCSTNLEHIYDQLYVLPIWIKQTVSQMTNFRLFQTKRVCTWQFWIWWKRQKVFQKGGKHWEKEKILVMSNFAFSCRVLKRLLLQTCKHKGLFGKGLTFSQVTNFRLFQTERVCRRLNFEFEENGEKLAKRVENKCVKRRNCSLWAFLLFPLWAEMFYKSSTSRRICSADTSKATQATDPLLYSKLIIKRDQR